MPRNIYKYFVGSKVNGFEDALSDRPKRYQKNKIIIKQLIQIYYYHER